MKAETHREVESVVPGRRQLELPAGPGRAQESKKRRPGDQERYRPQEARELKPLHGGAILPERGNQPLNRLSLGEEGVVEKARRFPDLRGARKRMVKRQPGLESDS